MTDEIYCFEDNRISFPEEIGFFSAHRLDVKMNQIPVSPRILFQIFQRVNLRLDTSLAHYRCFIQDESGKVRAMRRVSLMDTNDDVNDEECRHPLCSQ